MIRIILVTLLLTSCSGGIKVKTDLTCYWHEKNEANEETKAWLEQLGFSEEKITFLESNDWESWPPEIQEIVTQALVMDDWPEGFEQFLEGVGDDNELHDRNCG